MPTLVVRGPDGKEREVSLAGETTIGRAEGNDLVLAEGGVSRQHAKVTLKGEAVVIEDTGSANGTFIEGQRIGAPTIVPPGKTVQIGDYELRVKPGGGAGLAIVKAPRPKTGQGPAAGGRSAPRLGESSAPSTRTMPKRAGSGAPIADGKRDALARPARPARPPGPRVVRDAPEGPVLIGVSGLWTNKRWPVDGKVVVGRLPGVDVQLDDDSVSRRHAELELTPRGVRLKDLNSANGTAVNGMPVEGAITLQSGDLIQFGVVELQYENQAEEEQEASGEGRPRRGRLIVVAALCLVVLGGAAAAKVLLPGAGKTFDLKGIIELFGLAPKQPVTQPVNPQAAIQELLAVCRSFMRPEQGEPDWGKAEAACQKVLDVEPIQEEATALLKQIKAEQEALAHFQKADSLSARLRDEEALGEYGAIPTSSYYYLKVKPKLAEVVDKALKKSRADCDLYVRQRDYRSALPRCEAWLRLACQDMEKDDVTPPAGYTIRTNLPRGAKLKEREWAPPDPQVLKFYQVREKVDPTLPPWKCERMEILARGQQEESPDKAMARQLAKLYPDKVFAVILFDYYQGKNEQAVQALQKIRLDLRRTELHSNAEQLALDINAVASQYKTGQTLIHGQEVEKAADKFREALAIDQKLMGPDTVDKWPSWFRDAIRRDIAEASLEAGRTWMKRNDRKVACKYWRLGFGFYRGNVELLRAVGLCSTMANEAFGQAKSCADLEGVMALAIEGDGLQERVQDRKGQWGCQ